MPFDKSFTTIQIKPDTRDKLKALGGKGDTYDNIINELLKARKK